jgi:biotin operon repressor
MYMSKTQNQKLLERLSSGKNLTVREASSRYRIQNVSARISELREAGFTIFTNRVKVKGGADRGRVVTAYRLHVESSDTSSLLKDFGV